MNPLNVSLLQYDIAWENPGANLSYIEKCLTDLKATTDLVILPEMFSTGFSMRSQELSETMDGPTMNTIRQLAKRFDLAICGSFIGREHTEYYNRGFFITPQGDATIYDKRHLFRMGDEPNHYQAGKHRPIVHYKGWNICLLICYDLRFPVWSRNRNNEYDLLIYVANWPSARSHVWNTLLQARAIENTAYVCGVNRTGKDELGLTYWGESSAISPRGEVMVNTEKERQELLTVELSMKKLVDLRTKFPTWKDADGFEIIG